MISRSRFDAAYREQSPAAQKVYSAVPDGQFWPIPKIAAEMKRLGQNPEISHVAGCLGTLLHVGLVTEQLRGHFSKAEIKEPVKLFERLKTVAAQPKEENMKTATQPVSKKTPLEILGDISSRAIALSDMVKKFAADIENAAIEIQQQIETGDEETAKLRQLQSLLKSLG